MAFYKPVYKKISGKYYPQAVVRGKQITTKELAAALADRSTVTTADVYAVLIDLGKVMGTYMAQGRSVKLEGLGSFRYAITARKQGVDTAEEVTAAAIVGTLVRFSPESTRNADHTTATRTMVAGSVEWTKYADEEENPSSDGSSTTDPDAGGDSGSGTGSNPL